MPFDCNLCPREFRCSVGRDFSQFLSSQRFQPVFFRKFMQFKTPMMAGAQYSLSPMDALIRAAIQGPCSLRQDRATLFATPATSDSLAILPEQAHPHEANHFRQELRAQMGQATTRGAIDMLFDSLPKGLRPDLGMGYCCDAM